MGRQIIKQPNGLYCVYSSVVDNIILYDMTREEYIDERCKEFKVDVSKTITDICDKLDKGERAYYQFSMTYEEMLRDIKDIHGEKEMEETRQAIESTPAT